MTMAVRLPRAVLPALTIAATLAFTGVATAQAYFPGKGEWERRTPQQVGLDPAGIEAAVAHARASESTAPRDLELNHYMTFGREPFGDPVGPFTIRGDATGLIVHRGYIVAEWGEPEKIDPTFSVAKSFLSATVGLAHDRGLIRDVHDRVAPYSPPILVLGDRLASPPSVGDRLGERMLFEPFSGPHNSRITWDHLLRQTSDWEGTLWGKPDGADRAGSDPRAWIREARNEPGTVYRYNDVRVNLLALAALNVWRRPLPQVLKEHLMDPIGASDAWRWYGYDNSWVLLDGVPVQSVSGGTHWGGGLFINAFDLARVGLLTLHRGRWGDRQLLSEEWVAMSLTPTPAQQDYGFMNWYLNHERRQVPPGPPSAFLHVGAGNNLVYVDPENDVVIVARWITRQGMNGVVERVLQARR
jgi:CubicO group peptidase (beta-lactamase class C family)